MSDLISKITDQEIEAAIAYLKDKRIFQLHPLHLAEHFSKHAASITAERDALQAQVGKAHETLQDKTYECNDLQAQVNELLQVIAEILPFVGYDGEYGDCKDRAYAVLIKHKQQKGNACMGCTISKDSNQGIAYENIMKVSSNE